MPTHRLPRGSYTRDTIDWFTDLSATIGVSSEETNGFNNHWYNYYFKNDSNVAQYIWVYGINWLASGAVVGQLDIVDSPQGSRVASGTSIFSDRGAMAGALYVDVQGSGTTPGLNPLFVDGSQGSFYSSSFGASVTSFSFDLGWIILAPQAVLRFIQDYAGTAAGLGIQYQVREGSS